MTLRYWHQLPELKTLTKAQKRVLFNTAERITKCTLVSAGAFRRFLKDFAPGYRLRRCLECDYDLRGSKSSRSCPECGTSIMLFPDSLKNGADLESDQ